MTNFFSKSFIFRFRLCVVRIKNVYVTCWNDFFVQKQRQRQWRAKGVREFNRIGHINFFFWCFLKMIDKQLRLSTFIVMNLCMITGINPKNTRKNLTQNGTFFDNNFMTICITCIIIKQQWTRMLMLTDIWKRLF